MLPLVDIRDGALSFTVRGRVVGHLASPESLRELLHLFTRRGLHARIEVEGKEPKKQSLHLSTPIRPSLQKELLGELEAWYYTHSGEVRPSAQAA